MQKQYSSGFTLIELMIVVAIVAIIAAFAYPSYTRQVQSTRQNAAQGEMMSYATTLENYRAQNFSYAGAEGATTAPTVDSYTIVLNVDGDNRGYVMLARPTGGQAGTGALGLNERGQNCLLATNDTSCVPGTDPAW